MNRVVGAAALLLFVLSLLFVLHGVRAGASQVLYRSGKNLLERDPKGGIDTALARCETAFRLYPYSYHMCKWIGWKALSLRRTAQGEEIPDRVAAAQTWCERGLALNARQRKLQMLSARLLVATAPAEALAGWEEYVDWAFWRPSNHAFTVDLAIRAGDLGKASAALRWVRGRHRKRAVARLRRAWARERKMPLAPRRPSR